MSQRNVEFNARLRWQRPSARLVAAPYGHVAKRSSVASGAERGQSSFSRERRAPIGTLGFQSIDTFVDGFEGASASLEWILTEHCPIPTALATNHQPPHAQSLTHIYIT